jgi:hypothetical protein
MSPDIFTQLSDYRGEIKTQAARIKELETEVDWLSRALSSTWQPLPDKFVMPCACGCHVHVATKPGGQISLLGRRVFLSYRLPDNVRLCRMGGEL